MVDVGKAQAVDDEVEVNRTKHDPWIIHPWTEVQLQETVAAFNLLVDSIESRMPDSRPSAQQSLLSEDVLDAANVPDGFVRSFLSQAKRPRFKYIAPGLSIPDSESFPSQPLSSVNPNESAEGDEEPIKIIPILLFRSSEWIREVVWSIDVARVVIVGSDLDA